MNRYLCALFVGYLFILCTPAAEATESYRYSPGILQHWEDLDGHTGTDPEAICKLSVHRWQRDGQLGYLHIDGYSAYDSYFVYYCYNGADYLLPVTASYECPENYQRDPAYPIKDAKACYQLASPELDADQQPGAPDGDDSTVADSSSESGGGSGAVCAADSAVVGDPVNTAYGNKFESITDYRGSGISPLQFTRFYDSRMTRGGSLGSHWRHFYDRQIERLSGTRAKAWRADGKGITFNLQSGGWTAPGNIVLRLQAMADASGRPQGWQLRTGRDAIETYDAQGRLVKITERSGVTQDMSYDGSGRLLSVRDNFGRSLGFSYDAQGRVQQLVNPAGVIYRYGYDGDGNLVQMTDPDNRQTRYLYENTVFPHALTGVVDGNGLRIDNTRYGSDGKVVYNDRGSQVEPFSIAYDDAGSRVLDSYGASRNFTFSLIQGVMKSMGLDRSCPGCAITAHRLERDANGNITRRVDFNGIQTRYRYDLSRNLETGRSEAVGTAQERSIAIEWHADFRLPVRITMPGQVTEMSYDDKGNMTALSRRDVATGEQRQWHYQYGEYGQLQSVTLPGGETRTYSYDGSGNLSSMSTALGLVTRYEGHDANGRVGRVTGPGGRVTAFSYDASGHVLTRTEHIAVPAISDGLLPWLRSLLGWLWQLFNLGIPTPWLHETTGDAIHRYGYDAAGQLRDIQTPDGGHWHYDYDTAYRLVQRIDPLGRLTQLLRDPAGNITGVDRYSNGLLLESRRYVYDALGRLSRIQGKQGQQTTLRYDAEGALLAQTDALGNTTQYSRDALHRLDTLTDAAGQLLRLDYNPLDQLLAVTDTRGNVTRYGPNAFDEVVTEQSPDRGLLLHSYQQGHAVTETDARGIAHQYRYDADGRLQEAVSPHGRVQYRYDQESYGGGRLSRIEDASGNTRYRYNSTGQVVEKISTILNGASLRTRYSYTLAGQPLELLTPGGHLLRYERDSNGQPSRVLVDGKVLLSQIRWGAGDIAGWTWAGGGSRDEQRDLDGRLVSLVSGNALQRQYGYDLADRLVSMSDAKSGASESYRYDATGRLLFQQLATGQNSYEYDTAGNRQRWYSRQGKVTTDTRYQTAANSNRLLAETAATGNLAYSYLPSGQISSDGRLNYQYDDEGRLSEVRSASNQSLLQRATYNALGQRVLKQGRSTLVYAYDESGHLLGEYTPGGAMVREYVWMEDRLVGLLSSETPGAVLQVHADHLGTPRAVSQGNMVLWRWEGEAFGSTRPNESVAGRGRVFTMPLRFPGQYFDGETGLHYNYFRDYSSVTGRYMESDLIGLWGGVNTYAYVGSTPIHYIDARGLDNPGSGPYGPHWSNTPAVTFDASLGQITIVDNFGNPSAYPAANNTDSSSRGPWKEGIYAASYYVPHPNNDADSAYGVNGNFIYGVAGCTGCGIHSGRENMPDGMGRTGPAHATMGCIRTTDAGTAKLKEIWMSGGRPKLTVVK